MKLGMIGLGRMGANMAQRLMRGGHQLAGFDPKPEARKDLEDKGAESADSLATLIAKLPAPRTLWLMVPAGEITEGTLTDLLPLLATGDTVIDGGNSNYKDTLRRAKRFTSTTSTAVPAAACGAWKREFGLDLHQVAEIWRHGSVVRSWLLDLTAAALEKNPAMTGIAPYVEDSGEGRWTVAEAIDLDVSAPVITLSLIERLRSRDVDSYSDKLLAAMRNQFGGHAIKQE